MIVFFSQQNQLFCYNSSEAKMDDLEKQKVLKTEINDLQNKLAFQRNYINNLEETCQELEKKVKMLSQSVDVS